MKKKHFFSNVIKQLLSKTCSLRNIDKHIKDLNKKIKDCKSERGLKRYYENEEKKLNQRKIYYGKNKRSTITETK